MERRYSPFRCIHVPFKSYKIEVIVCECVQIRDESGILFVMFPRLVAAAHVSKICSNSSHVSFFFLLLLFFPFSTITLVYPRKITARTLSLRFVLFAHRTFSSSSNVIERTNEKFHNLTSVRKSSIHRKMYDARRCVWRGWTVERTSLDSFVRGYKQDLEISVLLLSRKKRKRRKLSRDINTGLIEYFFFGWSKKFFEYNHPLSFNS